MLPRARVYKQLTLTGEQNDENKAKAKFFIQLQVNKKLLIAQVQNEKTCYFKKRGA